MIDQCGWCYKPIRHCDRNRVRDKPRSAALDRVESNAVPCGIGAVKHAGLDLLVRAWPPLGHTHHSQKSAAMSSIASCAITALARSRRTIDAARTVYALGKHRLDELLAITMPGRLLARIIPLMRDKAIQGLADASIVPLLRSEFEDVRKLASVKYVSAFSRRRVRS